MNLIEIHDISDPRVSMFATLTEQQLSDKRNSESGIFIAESPKVINVALSAGMIPTAILCEQRHVSGDASEIIARSGNIPVYTGKREILSKLTGYTLTRGVLCAMQRPPQKTAEEVCRNATRLAVIDSVSDTTNIGAIFRSAAALGIDGVLLTPTSCDPLNRRAIRVSMGSVFLVPWTWIEDPIRRLKELGFKSVAMALTDDSLPVDSMLLKNEPRIAIIMGTEGDGLPKDIIESSDYVAKIPMSHNVDSLNVAAAAAVAFWELRAKG